MKWYRPLHLLGWQNSETGEFISELQVHTFKDIHGGKRVPVGDEFLDYMSKAIAAQSQQQQNMALQQNMQNIGQLLGNSLGQLGQGGLNDYYSQKNPYAPNSGGGIPSAPPPRPDDWDWVKKLTTKPAPVQAAKPEDEFTWLRRRVREMEWHG